MKRDLYVTRSKIHGTGLFTKKSFRKGKTVFILKGEKRVFAIRNKEDSRKFDTLAPDVANWIGIDKDTWIDPNGNFYKNLNHSCEPNLGIKGKVNFVALRNIQKGEELTFDYSISEDDIYWKFNCTCGSNKCRRFVRSIQYLPEDNYRKYYPFIPNHFKKVYTKRK